LLKTGAAGHTIVCGPPTPLITGGVMSYTVLVWLQVTSLQQSSFAVQVRVTLYSCGQVPGVVTSAVVTVRFWSQLSEKVGVPNEV
jgi:hypothetical protein